MSPAPVFSLDLTTGTSPDLVVDVRDAFCLYNAPDGAVAALRGLTLQVAKGERVVVQGPNGSGKTTLLRVLLGEQPLSAGRAVVAGREVRVGPARHDVDALSDWRASYVGWVDQVPARMLRPELDVLANVTLQQRLAGVRRGAAREAALAIMDRLGVATLAGRRIVTLSGGEAQRVAICAALAHGPGLVLADEPCGQLDTETAHGVYRALADAVGAAGAALVLVSHDRHAAEIADRVVRIRDGRLSEMRTPHQDAELLVVDDRGWVRLPEPLRRDAGGPQSLSARLGPATADGPASILLTPAEAGFAGGPAPRGLGAGPHTEGPEPQGPEAEVPDRDRTDGHKSDGDRTDEDRTDEEFATDRGREDAVARLSGVRIALGGRPVLDDVRLVVHGGELLVVRGRSGSGKSTLLRLLVGLERPDAGTVVVAGQDLAGLDREGLAALRRRLCAVVGQDVHLAETVSLRTNLDLARQVRASPGPTSAGPTSPGPTTWSRTSPDHPAPDRPPSGRAGDGGSPPSAVPWELLGLSALADRPVEQLSGGERQRAAVLRALSVGARLIVLDEPSSQLDEASAEQLAAALTAAARGGAAVVVATHDPVLAAAADAVLDLES